VTDPLTYDEAIKILERLPYRKKYNMYVGKHAEAAECIEETMNAEGWKWEELYGSIRTLISKATSPKGEVVYRLIASGIGYDVTEFYTDVEKLLETLRDLCGKTR
jgi:hypothetical protein